MKAKLKIKKIHRRQKRVRSRVQGTSDRPRFSVFKSNKHIYVQFIDDASGKTLLSISDKDLKIKDSKVKKGVGVSLKIGLLAGEKAKEKGIVKVLFDRGRYKYHGNIKSLADGAR